MRESPQSSMCVEFARGLLGARLPACSRAFFAGLSRCGLVSVICSCPRGALAVMWAAIMVSGVILGGPMPGHHLQRPRIRTQTHRHTLTASATRGGVRCLLGGAMRSATGRSRQSLEQAMHLCALGHCALTPAHPTSQTCGRWSVLLRLPRRALLGVLQIRRRALRLGVGASLLRLDRAAKAQSWQLALVAPRAIIRVVDRLVLLVP